jgi:hypothetical protein
MLSFIFVIVNLFIIVNSSNNIKSFIPNCKTCKWFIPNINEEYGKCKMFGEKNNKISEKNVFNYVSYNYAIHCRNNEKQCGKYGYLYEKNDLLQDIDIIHKMEKLKLNNKELYEYTKFLYKYDDIIQNTN